MFLRLIGFFTEHHELKLFWVCFMELILNQYKSLLASCSRFSNTVFKFAPQEHKVLSSAKLQISDFSMAKNRSLINMLNNKGPSMETCGIPCLISDHLL